MAKMVFSSLFEKHPNLRLILPHLGRVLPFLFERMDKRITSLQRMPRAYQKTPNRISETILLLYGFVPLARLNVCALFGRSRSYALGGWLSPCHWRYGKIKFSIEDLDIPKGHKLQVLVENGRKILELR